MKYLTKCKDGGSKSPVDAYFLVECKGLFSIALLKFNKGRREEFHTHAFDAFTWFLSGELEEEDVNGEKYSYKRGFLPKFTRKCKNHRVKAVETSWCFTLRGAWEDTWTEYSSKTGNTTVFSWGRSVVEVLERGTR